MEAELSELGDSPPRRTRSPDPEHLPGQVPRSPDPPAQFFEAGSLSREDTAAGAATIADMPQDMSAAQLVHGASPAARATSAAAEAGLAEPSSPPAAAAEPALTPSVGEASWGPAPDSDEGFDDLLGAPELNPEAALSDMDMRLRRVHEIEEQLRTEAINDYIAEFDAQGEAEKLTIGHVPLDDVLDLRGSVDNAEAEYRQRTAELERKRAKHLADSREEARKRVYEEHKQLTAELRKAEMALIMKERQLLRRLATRFRANEERLRMFLEGKQGEVRLADGNIKLKGRRYSMQDRSYSIEWERAPQPVALHLNCLRAVRDKLPRGSYVMHVSLYDHLAGNALQWSKLEHERWNDVTSVVEHGGDHRDVEISLDQSLRLVLPSQVMLAPSMVFVFELHRLEVKQFEEKQEQITTVVGWGAFPLVTSAIKTVEGKFKVPMLVGPVDADIDKFRTIESLVAHDLNRWLCNLYFAVEPLERLSEQQRQRNYEVQLQYTSELLGMRLLDKEEKDDFFMLMKSDDKAFDAKYDAIMSETVRRKSRRRMMGSSETSGKTLAPVRPGRSALHLQHKKALKRAVTQVNVLEATMSYEMESRHLEPAEELRGYRYSVAVLDHNDEPEVRRGIKGRLMIVYRELLWELWSSTNHLLRSPDLWWRVGITAFSVTIAFHVHYIAQYVWLSIFLVEPTVEMSFVPPVSVTYETAQLTALMEMGTVGAGILANLTDFLLLILIAVFFRGILDAVPKLYSDFVDAWCVYTVLSPFLICAYDLVRGNFDGDMFKLYNIYARDDGDGAVGMALTAALYIALILAGYVLSFVYFIYLHQVSKH